MFHRSNQTTNGTQDLLDDLRRTSPFRAQRGFEERSSLSEGEGFLHASNRSRLGLTLVELLVVITILMVLLGVVLPLASPSIQGRKIREAARQVNTAFSSAKSRAEGTARPAGVIIYPDQNDPERAFSVAFAKSPAYFSGSLDGTSGARVIYDGASDSYALSFIDNSKGTVDSTSSQQLTTVMGTNIAFLIRFNHRGRWHVGNVSGGAFQLFPAVGSQAVFQNNMVDGVPYQVLLPPKRSAAGAITLPAGTHIDLALSLPTATEPPSANPIAFMFDKENGLGFVYRGNAVAPVSDSLALLIVDSKISADDLANAGTVLDPTSGSMWVIVNNETGQVKTADNLGHTLANNETLVNKVLSAATLSAASTKAGGR